MRIGCPTCSATYDVPDRLLPPGRVTRCARCGGEWVPLAQRRPEPPPVALAVTPPAVSAAVIQPVVYPLRDASSTRLRLAWAASLVILALAIGAAFTWRNEIEAAWPASARAYAALGAHPKMQSQP
jgi:predicted Zn finger-like uncharacterized protein